MVEASGSETGPHAGAAPITAAARRIHILSYQKAFHPGKAVTGKSSHEVKCTKVSSDECDRKVPKLPFHQKLNCSHLAGQSGSNSGSSQGSTGTNSPFHRGHHHTTKSPHHNHVISLTPHCNQYVTILNCKSKPMSPDFLVNNSMDFTLISHIRLNSLRLCLCSPNIKIFMKFVEAMFFDIKDSLNQHIITQVWG